MVIGLEVLREAFKDMKIVIQLSEELLVIF